MNELSVNHLLGIKHLNVNDINLEEIVFFNFACSIFQGLNLIKESNRYVFLILIYKMYL